MSKVRNTTPFPFSSTKFLENLVIVQGKAKPRDSRHGIAAHDGKIHQGISQARSIFIENVHTAGAVTRRALSNSSLRQNIDGRLPLPDSRLDGQ